MEALSKEREALAKLEAEYKDLQSKFFNMKEKSENEEEQVRFFYGREFCISVRLLFDIKILTLVMIACRLKRRLIFLDEHYIIIIVSLLNPAKRRFQAEILYSTDAK